MSKINLQEEIKNIKKQGYLEKQSRFWKAWRKRWFVLTTNALISFKEQKNYKQPTEIIPILSILTIVSCDEETHKQNCFKLQTDDAVFYICAGSYSEKQQWIGEIGKTLVKISNNMNSNQEQ